MVGHPSPGKEWSIARKVEEAKKAGFHGLACQANPAIFKEAQKHKLEIVGYFASSKPAAFRSLIQSQKDCGCKLINVQLGDEDTLTPAALKMTLKLMDEADRAGISVSVEVHRDTCTETPEKTYALADAYKKAAGRPLRMNFDFSHLAVVKHLAPADFAKRLLTHRGLIQLSDQMHCRPFNGHHCQVPVTNGRGSLTPEIKDYLAFIDQLFAVWVAGNRRGGDLWVCPEMGPLAGGYNLSVLPSSWEDAKVLRRYLDKAFKKAVAG